MDPLVLFPGLKGNCFLSSMIWWERERERNTLSWVSIFTGLPEDYSISVKHYALFKTKTNEFSYFPSKHAKGGRTERMPATQIQLVPGKMYVKAIWKHICAKVCMQLLCAHLGIYWVAYWEYAVVSYLFLQRVEWGGSKQPTTFQLAT